MKECFERANSGIMREKSTKELKSTSRTSDVTGRKTMCVVSRTGSMILYTFFAE